MLKIAAKWMLGTSRPAQMALVGVIASVGIEPVTTSAEGQTPVQVTAQTMVGSIGVPVVRHLGSLPQLTFGKA